MGKVESASILPLKNVSALQELVDGLSSRPVGVPGMAAFYGMAGFGKTMACAYVAAHRDCVYLEMRSVWTGRHLIATLLERLGVRPARTMARMMDQVAEHMPGRTLLIDEADFLSKGRMLEIARDIYEVSGGSVVLVGEENLPTVLATAERIHSRLFACVPAQPADQQDIAVLIRACIPGLAVAPELIDRMARAGRGSLRLGRMNVERLRIFAATHDIRQVGADDWTETLADGRVPPPRRRVPV